MIKNCSNLTFKELFYDTAYIKVIWNGKVVYNEYDESTINNSNTTLCELEKFIDNYMNKLIYSAKVEVVHFHHLILDIIGE